MKNLLFTAALLIIPFFVQAQVRFGARAGLGVAGIVIRNHPDVQNQLRLHYQAGLLADILISRRFSIQPAVLFSGKGTRVNASYLSNTGAFIDRLSYDFRLFYVEMPVMFVLKHEISRDVRIYVGAGAYAGVGVGGRYHMYTNSTGVINYEGAIRYGSGQGGTFRRFDYGGCAAVGIERHALQLSVNYTLGVPDVSTQLGIGKNSSGNNARISTLNLSVGFLVGSKKKYVNDVYFEQK